MNNNIESQYAFSNGVCRWFFQALPSWNDRLTQRRDGSCNGVLLFQDVFGRGLSLETQYTDWLSGLATTRCRFILSDLVADKAYAAKAAEGRFDFMRTNAAFNRSMEIAYNRWRWVEKRLTK